MKPGIYYLIQHSQLWPVSDVPLQGGQRLVPSYGNVEHIQPNIQKESESSIRRCSCKLEISKPFLVVQTNTFTHSSTQGKSTELINANKTQTKENFTQSELKL